MDAMQASRPGQSPLTLTLTRHTLTRCYSQEELLSVRVKVGDGLVGHCGLENASPINIYDYEGGDELISLVLDPLLREGRRTTSALVHPVYGSSRGKGKVTAVILALNKRPYSPPLPPSPPLSSCSARSCPKAAPSRTSLATSLTRTTRWQALICSSRTTTRKQTQRP